MFNAAAGNMCHMEYVEDLLFIISNSVIIIRYGDLEFTCEMCHFGVNIIRHVRLNNMLCVFLMARDRPNYFMAKITDKSDIKIGDVKVIETNLDYGGIVNMILNESHAAIVLENGILYASMIDFINISLNVFEMADVSPGLIIHDADMVNDYELVFIASKCSQPQLYCQDIIQDSMPDEFEIYRFDYSHGGYERSVKSEKTGRKYKWLRIRVRNQRGIEVFVITGGFAGVRFASGNNFVLQIDIYDPDNYNAVIYLGDSSCEWLDMKITPEYMFSFGRKGVNDYIYLFDGYKVTRSSDVKNENESESENNNINNDNSDAFVVHENGYAGINFNYLSQITNTRQFILNDGLNRLMHIDLDDRDNNNSEHIFTVVIENDRCGLFAVMSYEQKYQFAFAYESFDGLTLQLIDVKYIDKYDNSNRAHIFKLNDRKTGFNEISTNPVLP